MLHATDLTLLGLKEQAKIKNLAVYSTRVEHASSRTRLLGFDLLTLFLVLLASLRHYSISLIVFSTVFTVMP